MQSELYLFYFKMKTIVVLCVFLAVAYSRPDSYDSRYDDFDAQTLVSNVRLLKGYLNCFLNRGPCTSEGNDFKKTIPEALRTSCSKCTPKQRTLIREVVKAFQTKTPELWSDLAKQEDPTGQYKDSFQKFINGSD
ncbi:unnamed protein product [Chrysodeixis includens]|uniref:Uncharacterized protein n=1 Tax=Chrysodeixis includens TaxID=689277 RepID=A0A9P0BTI2_CHRIL|nr:unnamed protein product [Chrysodeixis includens]